MEKASTGLTFHVGKRDLPSTRRWALLWIPLTLLLLFLTHFSSDLAPRYWLPTSSPRVEEPGFSWLRLVPSRELRYTACFGSFQCARLDVPLDWNSTSKDDPRVAVAVIRLPAKVPVTDERYGGAIIVNPGGPGESGVQQIIKLGREIQDVVDSPKGGKHFDIVSFDPRGVNNTTPRLKCFADAVAQHDWRGRLLDYGLLWSSPSVLGMEWGYAQAIGESCSRVDPVSGVDMVRYINTAQTVNDMLEIVERMGQWREAEATRISRCASKPMAEGLKWVRGEEKINYWGFSYGTALGQTFAAMHPSRIAKLVVDGNLDPRNYYAGKWSNNLIDSDKIITSFCEYCFQAGPEKCPLYEDSPVVIEARFTKIMMNLKENPLPIPGGGESGPVLITYRDMHLHMLTAMYASYANAERFFRFVAGVESYNTTVLNELSFASPAAVHLSNECLRDGSFSDACVDQTYVSGLGPFQAISCMDSSHEGSSEITKAEFKDFVSFLEKQSKWISPNWSQNRMACVGYKKKPAWTFEHPIEGNTSHPILAIGNLHDPVTPLQHAVGVTELFPSSVVVQQNSEGHCSVSTPSSCTGRIVREYFQTGKLPKNGTICTPEYKPFIGCVNRRDDGTCEELSDEDQEIWEALDALTRIWM